MKSRAAALTAVLALIGLIAVPSAQGQGAGGVPTFGPGASPSLSNDGRFIAWGGGNVSVRNIETGKTVHVGHGYLPGISGDGRYVAYVDSFNNNGGFLFVGDTLTNTATKVVPDTGPPPAGFRADSPQMSADGRYVAFTSFYPCPSPNPCNVAGGNSVWVADRQTGTITRVDVANGVGGAAANDRSNRPAISGDGRYIAFASKGTNLSADDTDSFYDIYVRDMQAGTTELLSRGNGLNGVKAVNDSHTAEISLDGRYVAFGSYATNLSPDDTNGAWDVYLRDRQTATTTLVSRASGAAGPVANAGARQEFAYFERLGLSTDGRYVSFTSPSTNLSPDDADSGWDAYVRDLQTNTTLLVSRASGPSGPKAVGMGNNGISPVLSENGRFVAFRSDATNLDPDRPPEPSYAAHLYVRDLQTHITTLENRLSAVYARPKAATPLYAALVPAYQPCTTPNREHAAPLSFDSCSPPAQTSPRLVVGTADANGQAAKSVSLLKAIVVPGNLATPADEAEVHLTASMTDVRNAPDLTDYTGELEGRVAIQITDKITSPPTGGIGPGTTQQFDLSFAIPCAGTPDTTIGATCGVTTTADTLIPGAAPEGARAIWEAGRVAVYDGGADGDGDTAAGNDLFLTQGVFVP